MAVILKGKELEEYNKTRYSDQWLTSAEHRLNSDYYKRDHNIDTLQTLLGAGGDKVLECGIGTGEFFAMELARGGKSVYGIDFSDLLLNDCRARFSEEGFTVRLGMADAQKLPFKDNVFDASYAIGVMPYMEDLDAAVGEMLRVTRPGGIVVFDMMNLWHPSQFINYWYRAFEASRFGFGMIDGLKRFKKSLGLNTNFKKRPEKVNYNLISPPKMLKAVKRAGSKFRAMGYNVLLPLDMPILGRAGNLCRRFPYFEKGLKDNKVLKYFGAKLVFVIQKG
jgi:ubiquinone/menaquinone biosynthesis C-methylase UbiE